MQALAELMFELATIATHMNPALFSDDQQYNHRLAPNLHLLHVTNSNKRPTAEVAQGR